MHFVLAIPLALLLQTSLTPTPYQECRRVGESAAALFGGECARFFPAKQGG